MTVRHCPGCARYWVPTQDETDIEECPTCRFDMPKLSTAHDGKQPKDSTRGKG